MSQIKHSFDKESLVKILKGAGIAGTGAGALFILKIMGTINFGTMTPIIAAAVPILVNVLNEWMKGDKGKKNDV